MTTQLTNINISEITLCKVGKNGLQFIAKSADSGQRIRVAITKTDPVKKIAVGVVYAPDQVDADQDTATAEEIEKAAWSALKNHAVVNKGEHGTEPVEAFLAESYIAKAGDPDGFAEGAWAVVVKVEDEALWAEIEKGELSAFSMGGMAEKTPVDKEQPAAPVEKGAYVDASVFTTGLNDSLKLLQSLATALGDSVEKVKALQPADVEAAVAKSNEGLTAQLAALQESVQKIAAATTDGRITSAAPGSAPAINPSNY